MIPFRDRSNSDNRRIALGDIPEEIRTGIRNATIQLRRYFRNLAVDVWLIGSRRHLDQIRDLAVRIQERVANNQHLDNEMVRLRELQAIDVSTDNFAMRIYDHFRNAFNRIERYVYNYEREDYTEYLFFLQDLIASFDDLENRDNFMNEILEAELAQENVHIDDLDRFYHFLNIPLEDPIGQFLYIDQENGGTMGARFRLQLAQNAKQDAQQRNRRRRQ